MINIAELIIEIEGKKLTKEDYKKHQSNASAGIDNIVCGLKSIGHMMFWAASNDNYDGEQVNADMQNIGILIEANEKLLERMLEVEANATFNLNRDK